MLLCFLLMGIHFDIRFVQVLPAKFGYDRARRYAKVIRDLLEKEKKK